MSLDQFFEAKKRLYPQSVKGKFRKIKWILNIIFVTIYCVSPFLRFNRGESSSNQAIFIDISNSRLYFFNIEIWPQETYYLAGILILAAVALFFITSLFGRIWCGYACFQTVWTDIFIAIEKIFQGDRNARIILDRKNSFVKFYKKFFTHFLWIIVSLVTGYIFVCYFNDAILLTKKFFDLQRNFHSLLTPLGWIFGIAGATYIMAGFAREHVCTYMCPYSRFQSAMFDRNTLIITYDEKRGEPRGKMTEKNGDCIDCKQCVVVCPTGIDIRNGLQMECIACGLCIDACDNIMDKINKPKGLIRYDTEANLVSPSLQNKFRILKARTFYYAAILFGVSFIMIYSLINKASFEVNTIADRNPLFVRLSDGSVRNGYTLKIANKTHEDRIFLLEILSPKDADIKVQSYAQTSETNLPVKAGEVGNFKIFIALPKELLEKITEENILIDALITDKQNSEAQKVKMVFVWENL